MPKRYRLHLSDGTVLLVDRDSLNTWLVDRKAMVQVEGSKMWLPLREFIAAEREAAFRASPRRTAKTREELPLIPPPPRKGQKPAPEPVTPEPVTPEPVTPEPTRPEPARALPPPRQELPLVPPPPRKADSQPLPPAPAEPEPSRLVSAPPTPPAPPREEPVLRAPPTPPPPRPTPPREPPPERVERPLIAPSDLEEEFPIGGPAGVEPVAAGPVVPPRRPLSLPVTRPDDSISPIPLVPLEEKPLTAAIPRPSPHPLAADVFAAEDGSSVAADTFGQDLPVIPLKPLPDEGRAREREWSQGGEVYRGSPDAGFEDRFDDEPTVGGGLRHGDVVFLRAMAAFGGVISRLLDSLVRYGRLQRSRRAARGASAPPRPAEPRQAVPPRIASALQSLGELLSAGIAKLGALRLGRAAAEAQSFGELLASATPKPAPRPKVTHEPPAPEILPTAAEPRWTSGELPVAEEWKAPVTPKPRDEPRPRPAAPAPTVAQRPPAISELPVLRLREMPKAEEDEGDLYDGEYEYPGEEGAVARFLRGVGLWTKRLILAAVLVGGGTWAALTWKHWFPRAGEVGQKALTTIDQQVRSIETQKQQEQALLAGVEQMPQLAPETVQLVLSRSGALEVPDLFAAASDAMDRGGASLSREEGLELAALRDEMLAALAATEREQIRDYERVRAIGVVSPSDERTALRLVAQGARSLPPERLARLQELLGKAIAAGLPQPSPPATP